MTRPQIKTLPDLDLPRTKPRHYSEWKTLKRWGELPAAEHDVPGYLLRTMREDAGLTQGELASQLKVTQQAVAQAERWQSNPTIGFMVSWARMCGREFQITIKEIPGA